MSVKKIFFTLFAIFISSIHTISYGVVGKNTIDPRGETIIENASGGKDAIVGYLVFTKDVLFNLLWIIVVGAFIYIGYLFVTARGKPDEFKKAWMHVIYAVVGIALVSSAWGIVTLVAGIDL